MGSGDNIIYPPLSWHLQSSPTKMYAHQNDRFSVYLSHQNDRLTVTRHTLIIIIIHHRKPCTRRLAGYVGVSNELNTVLFQFKREHSSETKLISVPLCLPAGCRSKRPTVPDFPDIEFVQSEGQRAPTSSREGTVSVGSLVRCLGAF